MESQTVEDAQAATQTQQSSLWSQIESQPVEKQCWGRLCAKNVTIKSLDLCNEEIKIGRDLSNDLCITKEHIKNVFLVKLSKLHFTINKDINDLQNPTYIVDHSRNGTFVNGKEIGKGKKMILKNDDIISMAHESCKAFVYKDLTPIEIRNLPDIIKQKYFIGRKLGSGACGVVHLIYDTTSCTSYAMKHVQKNGLNEQTRREMKSDAVKVMNEVNIMKSLSHPCVINMHDIINTPEVMYMILEYMKGGDLLTRIVSQQYLPEKIAKLYFLQICHAVQYLHQKGITHRDLKPDNILLEDDKEETLLKVSDFGLSKFVGKNSIMKTLCGTTLYVAPEVLKPRPGRSSYTRKVDIWSLGVVLFSMLSGTLPFSDQYGTNATEQILRGKFSFRHRSWKKVTPQAKKLIYDILTVDPETRPSMNDILNSAWLQDKEVIQKAEKLMKVKLTVPNRSTSSDMENNNEKYFAEPPKKRQRTK